jgi:hypothetical protein
MPEEISAGDSVGASHLHVNGASGHAPAADHSSEETPAERCARLDAERNQHDRIEHRGYDNDGRGDQSYQFEPGETVMRVFDANRFFGGEFGVCEVCGDAAAMIIPAAKLPREVWRELLGHCAWRELSKEEQAAAKPVLREAELKYGHRFCGLECYREAMPDGVERKEKKAAKRCPLCGGEWKPGEWRAFTEGKTCAGIEGRGLTAFCPEILISVSPAGRG